MKKVISLIFLVSPTICLSTTVSQYVEYLKLEPHIEGGFFHKIYHSDLTIKSKTGNSRPSLTSINYMLTKESPIGYFHSNKSDIIHYFQGGGPIKYTVIDPSGSVEEYVLGPDIENGQLLSLVVKGDYWKTSHLLNGEMGLISEAVSPGFDYDDEHIIKKDEFQKKFPDLYSTMKKYIK